MDDQQKKDQEFAKEYLSSLVDLTYNSKPLIDMLTILAEENIEHGQVIVDAVEQHISKVATEYKLPVLYLIDSIVKNVGSEYTKLFSHSIVNIFCGVFEKVNEKVRQKMFALRQTWNDVFSQPKLYALDIKTNAMDRAWPITAKVAPAIHVNPNFLKHQAPPTPPTQNEKDLQTQLIDKQMELLELQNRKLELEMARKLAAEKEKIAVAAASKQQQQQHIHQQQHHHNQQHAGFSGMPPSAMLSSANHNRVRVAPVTPSMLAAAPALPRVRDPRLARMQPQQQQQQQQHQHQMQMHGQQQAHGNMLPPPPQIPAALASLPPFAVAKTLANGSAATGAINPFGHAAAAASPFGADPTAAASAAGATAVSIQDQILADLELQIGRTPREVKQRVAHKTSPAKGGSGSNRSGSGRSGSSSKSSSRSASSTGGASKSKSSSSSSRDRNTSDRNRSGSDYKSSSTSSSSSSSRRLNNNNSDGGTSSRKKSRSNSTTSNSSPSKKSPKRSPSTTTTTTTLVPASVATATATVSAAASTTSVGTKGGSLAEKYRSYLERNREKSGSPTALKATTAKPDSSSDPMTSTGSANSIQQQQQQQQLLSETKAFSETNATLLESINTDGIDARMVFELARQMKRASEERTLPTEPLTKKSKAQKIDILFGTEDVDLRQLMNPNLPPVANSGLSTASDSSDSSPTKLDIVRAKLAATASRQSAAVRAVIPLDMDMRPQQQQETAALAKAGVKRKIVSDDLVTDLTSSPASSDNDDGEASGGGDGSSGSDATTTTQSSRQQKRDRRTESSKTVASKAANDKRRQRTRQTKWSAPVAIDASVSAPAGQSMAPPLAAAAAAAAPIVGLALPTPAIIQNPILPTDCLTQPPPILGAAALQPHQFVGAAPPPSMVVVPPVLWPQQQQQPPVQPQHPSMLWQHPPPTLVPPPPHMLGVMPPPPFLVNAAPPTLGAIDHPHHHQLMAGGLNGAPHAPLDAAPKFCHSITIDGISREIRYYGETAIAFMDNEPRELGFNAGERVIRVDQKDAIRLVFNDDYAPFTIDGTTYQIRFGTPMRELYINQQWYECLFGEPSYLQLQPGGRRHMFEVEGPSPQVRIGALRRDLCAGRVHLFVDSEHKKTFFLDALPQPFELNGSVHTLQFFDYFLSVCIDGQLFGQLEFGAMPKRFRIGGRDRQIRFSVLPGGQQAGKVFVKNMKRTERHRNVPSPMPVAVNLTPDASNAAAPPAAAASASFAGALAGLGTAATASNAPAVLPALNINDLLQKLVASGMLDTTKTKSQDGLSGGRASGKNSPAPPAAVGTPIEFGRPETIKQRQAAHVDALFAGMQCSSCGVRFPSDQNLKYSQHLDWHFRQNRRDRDLARRAHSRRWYYDVCDWVQYEEIEDTEEREKSWFETQQADLGADLGTQSAGGQDDDSSGGRGGDAALPSCVANIDDVDRTCDMCHDRFETFYNEETEDWHLRDAVREEELGTFHPICLKDYKASLASKAAAGREQMDVGDGDNAVDMELRRDENIELLDDDDDDVIVLPAEEPSVTEITDEDGPPANSSNGNVAAAAGDADDDGDDTGGSPTPQSLGELANSSTPVVRMPAPVMNYEPIGNESDLQILVAQHSMVDLDEFVERTAAERAAFDAAALQLQVKIKEEPRNKGYRDELADDEDDDDGFEEVGTIESAAIDDESGDILLQEIIDSNSTGALAAQTPAAAAAAATSSTLAASSSQQPQTSSATDENAATPNNDAASVAAACASPVPPPVPAAEPHTGLDGNIQPVVAAAPPSSATNKIKINITKNVSNKVVINSSENTEKHHHLNSTNSELNSVSAATTESSSDQQPPPPNHNVNAGHNNNNNQHHHHQHHGNTETNSDGLAAGWDGSHANDVHHHARRTPSPAHAAPEPEILFEYKPSMRNARFANNPTMVRNGMDASGLCSIM